MAPAVDGAVELMGMMEDVVSLRREAVSALCVYLSIAERFALVVDPKVGWECCLRLWEGMEAVPGTLGAYPRLRAAVETVCASFVGRKDATFRTKRSRAFREMAGGAEVVARWKEARALDDVFCEWFGEERVKKIKV